MKKSKLILGITAAALSVTLAIGGTLMLFSASTDTATNVVTLGNAKIELWEVKDGTEVKATTAATELTYDDVQPGDKLSKAPYVKNTGSVAVNVAVAGKLSVKNTQNLSYVDWYAENADIIDTLYNSLNIDSTKWTARTPLLVLDDDPDTTDVNEEGIYGVWYYTGILAPGNPTPYIFEELTIPDSAGNNFANWEISLDLTAYAVQNKNVADPIAELNALIAAAD